MDDGSTGAMTAVKLELHRKLGIARAAVVSKLDGLSDYDLRRPMTPTGTNLLGLVKHLAGVEYVYLGESFGRPPTDQLPWVADGSVWQGADMWALSTESSDYLIALYREACANSDDTVGRLDLTSPGEVPHWAPGKRVTTLGVLLIRMVEETGHHAGHADIIRELIDGTGGVDHDDFGGEDRWRHYLATIQAAADLFLPEPD